MTPTLTKNNNWTHIGNGENGNYYRINKTQGVKTIGFPKPTINQIPKNTIKMAKREAMLLAEAHKRTKMAPKSYGFIFVNMGSEGYFCGILQQHIEALPIGRWVARNQRNWTLFWRGRKFTPTTLRYHLENIFLRKGIDHQDMNDGNILVKMENNVVKKLIVIDFDYYLTRLEGENYYDAA